jgi:hypothetical protein
LLSGEQMTNDRWAASLKQTKEREIFVKTGRHVIDQNGLFRDGNQGAVRRKFHFIWLKQKMEVALAAAIYSGVCRQFYDLIEVQYMWCVRVCCNVRLKKTRGIAVSQKKTHGLIYFLTVGRHIM